MFTANQVSSLINILNKAYEQGWNDRENENFSDPDLSPLLIQITLCIENEGII